MARLTQTSIWNATGRVAFNRSEGDLTPAHGPRGAGSGAGRRRLSHSQEGYYVGRRLDATEVHIVSRAELEPLPQLNYQSSEAFNWGCSTAGALELAFAMLVYTTETRPTDLVCRTFCAQVVACLDPAGFVVSHGDIALWLMIAFSTPTPLHVNRVRRSCRHGPARSPLDSLMAEATMSTPNLNSARCRSLRVVPRPCGNWIVVTEQDDVVSAHITATEAELICLREGDELVVYDRYHRCHRFRRPAPRSAGNPQRSIRSGAAHHD